MKTYSVAESPRPTYAKGLAWKGAAILVSVVAFWAPLAWLLFRDARVMWP